MCPMKKKTHSKVFNVYKHTSKSHKYPHLLNPFGSLTYVNYTRTLVMKKTNDLAGKGDRESDLPFSQLSAHCAVCTTCTHVWLTLRVLPSQSLLTVICLRKCRLRLVQPDRGKHFTCELCPYIFIHQSHMGGNGTIAKRAFLYGLYCCCGRKPPNESQWLPITAAVVTCQNLWSLSGERGELLFLQWDSFPRCCALLCAETVIDSDGNSFFINTCILPIWP